MTQREFFTVISNSELAEDVKEYATVELAKLNATNEKKRNTPSKTALANQPILKKIENEVLGTEFKTTSMVAVELDITVQKASALLRQLTSKGIAKVMDVKVAGKGTVKAYALAD